MHLYVEGQDPVYADERLLAVHCMEGGKKTISLPRPVGKVLDILNDTIVAERTASFSYAFQPPDTVLFELVEAN